MQLDSALPWLALCLTRGLAARLSARLLKQFGSPEDVFRVPLRQLEACDLPGATAQAVVKRLYEKVLERGAILSEFPLGTHPAPENFPIRNRITRS